MKMFHSTSMENYNSILADGFILGPVYLAVDKKMAADYGANNGSDFVVIEVDVDSELLCADAEFVKGDMDIDSALDESLSNGSAFIDGDLAICGHTVYKYEDYDEVE